MKLLKAMILAAIASLGAMSYAQVIDKNATTDASTNGSLWVDGKSPFTDRTARRAGDLITILISESSVATLAANTSTSKKADNGIASNLLNSLFGILKIDPKTSANSTSTGTGTTSQNGSLRARLTAEVKSVTSTGNLIIEGTRTIVINKETQLFKITGVIRRDDVAADNTLMSESIAQAEIRFEGKGQVADRQRKGAITTVLDWLF